MSNTFSVVHTGCPAERETVCVPTMEAVIDSPTDAEEEEELMDGGAWDRNANSEDDEVPEVLFLLSVPSPWGV